MRVSTTLATTLFLVLCAPGLAAQTVTAEAEPLDLRWHWVGIASLALFAIAYLLVMLEEVTELRKSKPIAVAAGLIWLLIGIVYAGAGQSALAVAAVRHNLLEYAELLLFLIAAMTYVNVMEERRVFEALRGWLVRSGFGYRQLFWLTGALAFVLSPFIDNLTTALVMGAVVVAVGGGDKRFVPLACINVVVAANAGGAFSPFGDITTLMVWQRGHVAFFEFFVLFVPSLVNFLVPAVIMHFAVPKHVGEAHADRTRMKPGAWAVILLFALTIATAISFHNFLHLPPVFGMMLGLGYLQLLSFGLQRLAHRSEDQDIALDAFEHTARAEWDTLFFFYGVIIAVGGLALIGYLGGLSDLLYGDFGPTVANIAIGVGSAIFDNIPLMFAVLSMNPQMSHGQWLLVTLTAGVGGSMLSIGSAAGVALMGTARGNYTFLSHLKWSWAIALGYAASIAAHLLLNQHLF